MLYHEYRARKKGYRVIAGVDEAGRGPLAGPVVAAAVVLKTHRFKNRIDDSKKLNQSKRLKAFNEIYDKAFVGVGIINEKIIDYYNIQIATSLAMRQALDNLCIRPDFILVDGNIKLDIHPAVKNIIFGDAKSLSIASASIVAKVMRDRLMAIYHRIYKKFGFNHHKGYGTQLHLERLKKLGPCLIHRKTFRPISELRI